MYDVAMLGYYNNKNFGGQLTVLSTYSAVKELGYSVLLLKNRYHENNPDLIYNRIAEFTKGFIESSKTRLAWNKYFKNFILCSDWSLNKKFLVPIDIRTFQWVAEGKNCLSVSASFGVQHGGYTKEEYPIISQQLKKFNFLSIREKNGVDFCKQIGVDHAQYIPDPVFFHHKEYYINISNLEQSQEINSKYVAVYLLDMNDENIQWALDIAKKINLKPLFIVAIKDKNTLNKIEKYDYIYDQNLSIANWLYYLNNAEYVITNSFHGICLSLILEKDFCVLDRKRFGGIREKNILNDFNLLTKFISKNEDIDIAINTKLQKEFVTKKIKEYKDILRDYLKSALISGDTASKSADKTKNISSLEGEKCVGCMACVNICPEKCIISEEDKKTGFLSPKVIMENCIDCGLCQRTCPVIHKIKSKENEKIVYCGYSLNEDIRVNSTSGGFFSELARKVLSNNGSKGTPQNGIPKGRKSSVIFGAAYDTPYYVCHADIQDEQSLHILRQSKYVQSDMKNTYLKILGYLQKEHTVMFCGTPCQCNAVAAFMKSKKVSTDKLYLIDFICHSVNSPLAYRAYLEELCARFKDEIKTVHFKNKETTWQLFSTRIDFVKNKSYYIKNRYEDDFYKGFLKYNLFSRPCCKNCNFKGTDRISDITLGDAWGIRIQPDISHGVSTAIINSEKGLVLFNSILKNIYYEQKTLDDVIRGNKNYVRSTKCGLHSDFFYDRINSGKLFSHIIKEIEEGATKSNVGTKINSLEHLTKNGAILDIHPSAKIETIEGGRLRLNHGKLPGSKAECYIKMEEGAQIIVTGDFRVFHSCRIELKKNAKLILGNGYMNVYSSIICSKQIEIGDAIIAPNCYIVDSDFHAIKIGNKVINPALPIKFEGHVWLGQNVTVLKGVTIGYGSIVGAKSLVNRSIPAKSLAVGNPAKVVKSGVAW